MFMRLLTEIINGHAPIRLPLLAQSLSQMRTFTTFYMQNRFICKLTLQEQERLCDSLGCSAVGWPRHSGTSVYYSDWPPSGSDSCPAGWAPACHWTLALHRTLPGHWPHHQHQHWTSPAENTQGQRRMIYRTLRKHLRSCTWTGKTLTCHMTVSYTLDLSVNQVLR